MRGGCLTVPRVLLPRAEFERWAVPAADACDRAAWQRIGQETGEAPSALRLIVPDALAEEEDCFREAGETAWYYLEENILEKLNRGFILTERIMGGEVRRGILATFDLEDIGEGKTVNLTEEIDPALLENGLALRRASVLEFPHAVLLYRDKHDKIMKNLMKEDLEELYRFDLMEDGGKLRGYYLPEDLSLEVAAALDSSLRTRFAVLEGNQSVAAAKAYWEELKPSLTDEERYYHPARYMLAEFTNLYTTEIFPVHRLVTEIDREALASFLAKEVRGKRTGNLFSLAGGSPAAVLKADAALSRYLRANGGRVAYLESEEELAARAKEEDSFGIVLKPVDREDLFGLEKFPKKAFSLGKGRKRYCLEGREISYD